MEAKDIVESRQSTYGSPLAGFWYTNKAYESWLSLRRQNIKGDGPAAPLAEDKECAARHAVYQIFTKLSRLTTTLDHQDSWDDIAGYVECAKECLGIK